MKKITRMFAALAAVVMLAACGSQAAQKPAESQAAPEPTATVAPTEAPTPEPVKEEKKEAALEDGVYTAVFDTDSSMFHVNEALEGKGVLTVENGEMTIHVTLSGKGILNLYPGLAEDAQKEGAELLEPSSDEVKYSDGTTEEAYGFDIPVPCLDEEFDCALIGKKGKWYDHKVTVSDPEPYEG